MLNLYLKATDSPEKRFRLDWLFSSFFFRLLPIFLSFSRAQAILHPLLMPFEPKMKLAFLVACYSRVRSRSRSGRGSACAWGVWADKASHWCRRRRRKRRRRRRRGGWKTSQEKEAFLRQEYLLLSSFSPFSLFSFFAGRIVSRTENGEETLTAHL